MGTGTQGATSWLSSVPWDSVVGAGVLLVVGIVLWITGRAGLRGFLAVIGAIMGLNLASMIAPLLGAPEGSLIPGIVGAVGGLTAGLVAYRLAVMLLAAVLGTLIGFTVAGATLIYSPGTADRLVEEDLPGVSALARAEAMVASGGADSRRGAGVFSAWPSQTPMLLSRATGLDRLREVDTEPIESAWASAKAEWSGLTLRERTFLISGSVLGLIVGVLASVVVPSWMGALLVSIGGAAMMLPAVSLVSAEVGWPSERGPDGVMLLAIWAGLSALGAMIYVHRKASPKTENAQTA